MNEHLFTAADLAIVAGALLFSCACCFLAGRAHERALQRRRAKAAYRAELNGLREPRHYIFTR